MANVPSNLIPTRLTQLPIAPVNSPDGYVPYVYQGVTYKARVGDLSVPVDVSDVTGVLPTLNGGTGVAQAPVSGGIVYSDADGFKVSPAGSLGQVPVSQGPGVSTAWGSALMLEDRSANTFYAGPVSGGLGSASFRALVSGDLPASAGTVKSVSVVSANGFAGTVVDSTTTPSITLTTGLTGMLKGNGSAMQVAVGGTDYLTPAMTATGDMVYGGVHGVQTRLPGNTTVAQLYLTMIGDGVNAGVPAWQPVSAAGNLSFIFANLASDVGGYLQAVAPSAFVAAAAASVSAAVTTTPALIVTFATNVGFPNITSIPVGIGSLHWESTKASGGMGYNTYAEVYKRTSGGVETLIGTSDASSTTSANTLQSVYVSVLFSSSVPLNLTDRIVVKIYGQLLSGSSDVAIRFDDNTGSLISFPSVVVDSSNFLPYIGATANVDLGSKSLTTTGNLTGVLTALSGGSF